MTGLYIILAAIAIILFAVLFVKMTLDVSISKGNGEKFNMQLLLRAFGHETDLLKILNSKKPSKKDKQKNAEETPAKEDDETDMPSLAEKIHNLRVNIERGRYTYLLSKRYVRKKIRIDSFDFDMTFGLDDAAHTGIATGAAWGSVYNIFGFVSQLFTVKAHKFTITPVFEGECFSFTFNSKIRFSISNLLGLAFAVMINYLKSKKKIK